MGISSIIASTLKGVSWQKIAGLAMEYGPEFYRQARGRSRKENRQPEGHRVESALQERIGQLERLLVEQEELIGKQAAEIERLQGGCLRLEGRLKWCKIATATLAATAILLAVVMIIRG